MAYVIDRQRAFRTAEAVAVVKVWQRPFRSRVIFRDNSLYQTATRPRTLLRYFGAQALAGRLGRTTQGHKGVAWWTQR